MGHLNRAPYSLDPSVLGQGEEKEKVMATIFPLFPFKKIRSSVFLRGKLGTPVTGDNLENHSGKRRGGGAWDAFLFGRT